LNRKRSSNSSFSNRTPIASGYESFFILETSTILLVVEAEYVRRLPSLAPSVGNQSKDRRTEQHDSAGLRYG
jgi:hypothetical protein